jgi:hypothetical protein
MHHVFPLQRDEFRDLGFFVRTAQSVLISSLAGFLDFLVKTQILTIGRKGKDTSVQITCADDDTTVGGGVFHDPCIAACKISHVPGIFNGVKEDCAPTMTISGSASLKITVFTADFADLNIIFENSSIGHFFQPIDASLHQPGFAFGKGFIAYDLSFEWDDDFFGFKTSSTRVNVIVSPALNTV